MINKGDFVELDFVAKIKETNEIFDTTKEEEAKKIGIEKVKPLRICVGEGMLLKGLEATLEGKELNKKYVIELKPKDAFGERSKELVKTIPLSVFLEKNLNPVRGMTLNMDGILARILSVGSRVLVDFNNPLAGKDIIYEFEIKRKIEGMQEKFESLVYYYLGEHKIMLEGKKAVIETEEKIPKNVLEELKKRAKKILDIEMETKEIKKEETEKEEKEGMQQQEEKEGEKKEGKEKKKMLK